MIRLQDIKAEGDRKVDRRGRKRLRLFLIRPFDKDELIEDLEEPTDYFVEHLRRDVLCRVV